ncbi:ABC transporter permease [Caloramator sp. ALD01]|uniref:ABC transporter permease n=1 Tax=Caloramator sp. ALD01 TaxID=1031288 RepID=UPI00041F31A7|nr:ABC transporter permease [Caloramator sp. ALD01]
MRLPFKIANRFLWSNKAQTALIALGIAVGVAVQIFIGSLITGLQESLINKTVGNSPHVKIISEDKYFKLDEVDLDQIKKIDDNINAVSYSLDVPALISKGDKNTSILLRGFDLERADKIYNIKNRIIDGKAFWGDKVNLGKDLAKEFDIKVGDKINIITSDGKSKEFEVAGVYDFKVSSLNKSWIILNVSSLQEFINNNNISSVEIKVDDIFSADLVAENIKNNLSSNLKVTNWKQENEELLSGLKGQSISSTMIQVFVLIAVVLGIASVLAITVLQKSKQIGILKAMGIKDRQASYIFLFQGLMLGVLGGILGSALGLGLLYSFSKFAVNKDGTPVVEVSIKYGFIVFSAFTAILSAGFASLIPAVKSSKLNPIEVIKNG